MTVLIIVLSCAALYLAAGWHIALRCLPRSWVNARATWSDKDMIRVSVKQQTAFMFLAWPAYLTIRVLSAQLGRVVDAGDPQKLKKRIAELERELGIR
jgi:hypothetical protein